MMTLKEWLCSPCGDKTMAERLAELIGINGGSMRVNGWGIHQYGGPYERFGLEMEEALELIAMGGVVEGFCLSGADFDEFKKAINAEFEKVERQLSGDAEPPKPRPVKPSKKHGGGI